MLDKCKLVEVFYLKSLAGTQKMEFKFRHMIFSQTNK